VAVDSRPLKTIVLPTASYRAAQKSKKNNAPVQFFHFFSSQLLFICVFCDPYFIEKRSDKTPGLYKKQMKN
jgi:hypothetical protein